jgi:hypothetical protein
VNKAGGSPCRKSRPTSCRYILYWPETARGGPATSEKIDGIPASGLLERPIAGYWLISHRR